MIDRGASVSKGPCHILTVSQNALYRMICLWSLVSHLPRNLAALFVAPHLDGSPLIYRPWFEFLEKHLDNRQMKT